MSNNKQLVLTFFPNEYAADAAVDHLKQWSKATKEMKVGGMGILVKDENGKIKTLNVGSRKTGTGALIGLLVGLLTPVSVIGGAIVGAVVGAFVHTGAGISKADLARFEGELTGGKAALCVLVEADEVEAVTAKVAELGGKPETHEVTEEALAQVTAAAEAEPEVLPEA